MARLSRLNRDAIGYLEAGYREIHDLRQHSHDLRRCSFEAAMRRAYGLEDEPYSLGSSYGGFNRPTNLLPRRAYTSQSNSMTIGKVFRYAAIGACYGAAAVVGVAALAGAAVMPALTVIAAGAAFGAVALPGLRAMSKTAGRIVAYGPISAAAVTAGCVLAGGVGHALAWGVVGTGAVAMMALAHRPEEFLTGRRGADRNSFRY